MESQKIITEYYCGVDLHARANYICVLNKDDDIMLERNIKNNFLTFKQNIIKLAKHHNYRDYVLLLSVPGIGTMIALNILYEIHNIARFKTVQKFSSYCRVVKCDRSSAGKSKAYKNQKIGNPYLKWAMSQIIINAQTNEDIKKYTHKLESKYGRRRARAQIAHKFTVAIYFML